MLYSVNCLSVELKYLRTGSLDHISKAPFNTHFLITAFVNNRRIVKCLKFINNIIKNSQFSARLRTDFLREILILREPTSPFEYIIGNIQALDDLCIRSRKGAGLYRLID